MQRKILIGIDGANWEFIQALIDKGELPVINSLIKNGVSSKLNSIKGMKSPALWHSIATGKLPDKTGVFYFTNTFLRIKFLNINVNLSNSILLKWPYLIGRLFSKDLKSPSPITDYSRKCYIYSQEKLGKILSRLGIGGNYLVTSSFRKEKSFWEILSEKGIKCGVVNWLITWPPDKIDGWFISHQANKLAVELGSSSRKTEELSEPVTYPDYLMGSLEELSSSNLKNIGEDIGQILPLQRMSPEEKEALSKRSNLIKNNLLESLRWIISADRFAFEAAIYTKQKIAPEFLTVYLAGIDSVQHHFLKYHRPEQFSFLKISKEEQAKFKEVIPNYYRWIDKQIGRLISDEDEVIIVSDHGIEPISEKDYDHNSIRSGQHERSPDGILIMKGPDFKKGYKLKKAHLLDVAPTLIYSYSFPVDNDNDGEVLLESFVEAFQQKNQVKKEKYNKRKLNKEKFYSKNEEKDAKEVLKNLGYLK